jgi:predicted CoA-binding protein
MIDPAVVTEFLSHDRIAVVGASSDRRKFGNTVFRTLRAKGYTVVPVNPRADAIEGVPCVPDVASIEPPVDGAVVMVGRAAAVDVVRDCVTAGVPRVWLFKGLGAEGAVSDEAVALCEEHGIPVVAGACPLMFLEPVGWFHRIHRTARHLNGSVARAA